MRQRSDHGRPFKLQRNLDSNLKATGSQWGNFNSKLRWLDLNLGKDHSDDNITDAGGRKGKAGGYNIPSYVPTVPKRQFAHLQTPGSAFSLLGSGLFWETSSYQRHSNNPPEETSIPTPLPPGSFFFPPEVFFTGTDCVMLPCIQVYFSLVSRKICFGHKPS